MSKIISFLVGSAIFIAALYYFISLGGGIKKNTVEESLAIYVREINKNQSPDPDGLIIEKPATLSGKNISFNYRIPAIKLNEINEDGLREFNHDIYSRSIRDTCNGTLNNLLSDGALFSLVYYDVDDLEFTRINIGKSDCDALLGEK